MLILVIKYLKFKLIFIDNPAANVIIIFVSILKDIGVLALTIY